MKGGFKLPVGSFNPCRNLPIRFSSEERKPSGSAFQSDNEMVHAYSLFGADNRLISFSNNFEHILEKAIQSVELSRQSATIKHFRKDYARIYVDSKYKIVVWQRILEKDN